jgi:hypothetical protein
VVRQLVIGKDAAGHDVGTHGLTPSVGLVVKRRIALIPIERRVGIPSSHSSRPADPDAGIHPARAPITKAS